MPAFDRPSAISDEHLALAGREPLERAILAASREQLRDHLGVECGAAVGDAANGLEEVGDVHDPVLEQIADAASAVGEQLLRVRLLDVLRDHQHGRARHAATRLERSAQSLVVEVRRQSDVDDREVGLDVPRPHARARRRR